MRDPLDSLSARPVLVIMEAMRQLRARSPSAEIIHLPLVTLHVETGSSFRGWIIDANPSSFLLRLDDGDTASTDFDLLYVNSNTIAAITIHDAASLANILAFGKIEIPAPPQSHSITPQEARRQADNLANSLSQILRVPITFQADLDDTPHLPELLTLMTETTSILRQIAANPTARQRLTELAHTIEFKNTPEPSVTINSDRLIITAALDHSQQDRFDPDQLRHEIEKWLR